MIDEEKQLEIYDLISDKHWEGIHREIDSGFPLDAILIDLDTVPGLLYKKYFAECFEGRPCSPELKELVLKIFNRVESNVLLKIKSINLYGSIFTTDLDDAYVERIATEGFSQGVRFSDPFSEALEYIFTSDIDIRFKSKRLSMLIRLYPENISSDAIGRVIPGFFVPGQQRCLWSWDSDYEWAHQHGKKFQFQVESLIENGACINAKSDDEGHTGVMRAAMTWMPEALEFLISKCADVNITNDMGNTALMYVSGYLPDTSPMNEKWEELPEHLQIAKILIEAGADISVKNKSGDTALDLARKNKNTAVLEFLESL